MQIPNYLNIQLMFPTISRRLVLSKYFRYSLITYLLILVTGIGKSESRKKSTTTMLPGAWGAWQAWDQNCSVTCGIGFRRRRRFCSYGGRNKELRCKGNAGEIKNCDTKLTCPVDGGWTSWTAWECTASCGGGQGMQKRSCTNPKPMFKGKDCEGPSEEKGKCNTQKCPDQVFTLSPETERAVKESIDEVHLNFEKKVGDFVRIPCSSNVVIQVYREYPGSSLMWTKNGEILKMDQERMSVTPTALSIRQLKPQDNGVYVCSIHYAPLVVKPLSVAALTVISPLPSVQVPAEEKIRLICHGIQLAKIFKNLTQKWYHNNRLFKDFGSESPVENNLYKIEEVTLNMTGIWTCRITDPIRGRKWTTNVLAMEVLPPIPKYLKFLSDRNLLLTIGTVVFVVIMSIGTFCGYQITNARRKYMADFEKWCQIAKWEKIKAGGNPQWAATTYSDSDGVARIIDSDLEED